MALGRQETQTDLEEGDWLQSGLTKRRKKVDNDSTILDLANLVGYLNPELERLNFFFDRHQLEGRLYF